MSSAHEIVQLTSAVQHSEGPYWDVESNTLYWVDTFEATLYRLKLGQTSPESYKLEGRDSVGFLIPLEGQNDRFLVFSDRMVYELHWPLDSTLKSTLKLVSSFESHKPNNQFNDGKADVKGRIWGGTLTRNADLSVADNGGSLYMFDNSLREVVRIKDTSISNGMAWNKNSTKFFYIDSPTRCVAQYDFDASCGKLANKKILLDLAHYPEVDGMPDGMTIDQNDNLWIALFGGQHVLQVDQDSGKILQKIKMPVNFITSLAFGGPELDVLYATTSKVHEKPNKLIEDLAPGGVFAITGLGVKGLPAFKASCQLDNNFNSSGAPTGGYLQY